mgnify:CR=1 FL=1
MFTGIIKNIGTVEQINLKNNFLSIKSDFKEVSQGLVSLHFANLLKMYYPMCKV